MIRWPELERLPCSEVFDLGPFRFECVGHIPLRRPTYPDKIEHRSLSPRKPGDVEVTWWTAATFDEDDEAV